MQSRLKQQPSKLSPSSQPPRHRGKNCVWIYCLKSLCCFQVSQPQGC